jgi:methyltransferase (TIGR00027 family)
MRESIIEEKPSETALFVALRRTLAHKEYHNERFGPDYLAEIFLPAHYRFFLRFAKVRENTKFKLAAAMPGMNEYIIARTAFFDGLFLDALKNQLPQIVLLGAGYDSRVYRFTRSNRGTRVYELDTPSTQDRKIKSLKAAHISIPDEVLYVPINFMNESLSDVLEKAGFKIQERTLFIWEGVSMYLDEEAVKKTLGFLSHSHTDSLVAFDYTITLTNENMHEYYGATVFIKSMEEHHASEKLLFSVKPGEIESFLKGMNFRIIEHLDHKAIAAKYLSDDDGFSIGRMAENYCLVRASPM